MNKNLFVRGLSYETKQEELAAHFQACGAVLSAKILVDRETGKSRGIGFVEMGTDAEAHAAITKLNGSMLGSRRIFVDEARPQEKRPGFEDRPAGPAGPARPWAPPSAAPGFVERRSGLDRRKSAGAPARRPEPAFDKKKPWERNPNWETRPPAPGGFKKPWEKKPWAKKDDAAGGFKKPWEKKPWAKKDDAPGGFKKPWAKKGDGPSDKASGPPRKKKWGAAGPAGGKKWGSKPKRFGSGFKARRPK